MDAAESKSSGDTDGFPGDLTTLMSPDAWALPPGKLEHAASRHSTEL
jgi:hypothetical protein